MEQMKYQLENYVYETKKALEEYTSEYDTLPEGSLIRCKNNGAFRLYVAWNEDGRYRRKAVDKGNDLTRKLARKEYLKAVIRQLKNNKKNAERLLKKMSFFNCDEVIRGLPKACRELPEEYFFDRNKEALSLHLNEEEQARCVRHAEWGRQPYNKSDYKPEWLKFTSSEGIKVRSKSELIIAEECHRFGVPLRYEQVIQFGDKIAIPDFTFEDVNGELFFWEHAGMMNVPEYRLRHKRKMELYDSFGIVPWKNLVVTYDVDGAINLPMIRSIIKNEVIPRL